MYTYNMYGNEDKVVQPFPIGKIKIALFCLKIYYLILGILTLIVVGKWGKQVCAWEAAGAGASGQSSSISPCASSCPSARSWPGSTTGTIFLMKLSKSVR